MRENIPPYLIVLLSICVLLLLTHIKRLHSYSMILAYIFGLVLFSLVLHLSIFRYQDRPAGIALSFFVVVPLLFIEKSWRMNIYVLSMFIAHSVLSFMYKGFELGSVDFINTLTSMFLGIFIGRLFLVTRLNTFEMERQLKYEKETDFLTKLNNYKRLYDDLKNLNEKETSEIGVLVFDLDYFKQYNDKYGHLQGDKYLAELGSLLLSLENEYPVRFYRFGGEKFVGLTYNAVEKEVIKIAENIRGSVKKISVFNGHLTISFGVSIIKVDSTKTIEYYLDKSDKALYKAKESGRNRIEFNS